MRILLLLIVTLTTAFGQKVDLVDNVKNILRPIHGGLGNEPGVTLPPTCTEGDLYFKVDATPGANLYGCTSTDTWTLLGSGGGGSGVTSVATGCGTTGGTITSTGTIRASELVNPQAGTGNYTILNSDCGKLVTHLNGGAIIDTLPQANAITFVSGWYVDIQNRGAGTVTITPTTSTIDDAASLVLQSDQGVRIVSNGTNYFTQRGIGSSSGGGSAPLPGNGILVTGSGPWTISINPLVAATLAGSNTLVGALLDASAVTHTIPVRVATADPGTCTVGELLFRSDLSAGANLKGCTSANVWSALGGGGSVTASNGAANRIAVFSGANTLNGLPNSGNAVTWDGFALGVNGRMALTPNGGAGTALDCATVITFQDTVSSYIRIRLTGNCTASSTGSVSDGQVVFVTICQDGTGGRTFTWPAEYVSGLTVAAGANKCNSQSFIGDLTNSKYYATSSGVTNQ